MHNNALIKKVARRILSGILSFCLLFALSWLFPLMPQAVASEQVATFDIARNPVEQGLDKLDREGTKYQVEGAIDEAVGKTQRKVGKVTGQTEGAFKQAEGQAEEAVGSAKDSVSEVGNKAEDASQTLIDKVKDFFD